MRNVGLERSSLHVVDGHTVHHSAPRGIAAGVAHLATGAHWRPASAMNENVPRCKFLHDWLIKR